MRRFWIVFALFLKFSSWTFPCFAEGLSTTFSDVDAGVFAEGQAKKVLDPQGHGLTLRNLGTMKVSVAIEALVPQPTQLRGGAEAVPDVQWVDVTPRVMQLQAYEEKECILTIKVPRGKTFRGRSYQVMIWSHGTPSQTPGMTISAGLLSRVRFRTKG